MMYYYLVIQKIDVTVATFETAKKKTNFFLRMEQGTNGYSHT